MNELVFDISDFLVKYLYKWILPITITLFSFAFADRNKNIFILFVLWVLLCIAYLSIPWNFENPKRKNFLYFYKSNISRIIWVVTQTIILSISVFGITMIIITYYFPIVNQFVFLLSLGNALLYLGTLLLEYSILDRKLSNRI